VLGVSAARSAIGEPQRKVSAINPPDKTARRPNKGRIDFIFRQPKPLLSPFFHRLQTLFPARPGTLFVPLPSTPRKVRGRGSNFFLQAHPVASLAPSTSGVSGSV